MKTPRLLRKDEIECRIQSLYEGKGANKGKVSAVLLLYKDARCDMDLLDETFGPMNWQRDHKEVNGDTYCGIGVWDEEKKQWVWKWDVGEESNQSAIKGRASDGIKRADVNWGIGRELYTAPFMYIEINENEYYKDQNGKLKADKKTKFYVSDIRYNEKREINHLVIVDGSNNVRYPKNGGTRKKEQQLFACSVCGKTVKKDIADKSVEINGAVFCSGTCKKSKEEQDLGSYAKGLTHEDAGNRI